MGDFDKMFSAAVWKAKVHSSPDIKLILVKPYFSNELNTNREYYESYYDNLVIPCELLGEHYKSAIKKRNRWMVDQCEYVIGCVFKDYGGAYAVLKYDSKQNKLFIKIKK